jgi:hypothetical protein
LCTIQKEIFKGCPIQALIIACAPVVAEKLGVAGFFSGSDIKRAWLHIEHLPVV